MISLTFFIGLGIRNNFLWFEIWAEILAIFLFPCNASIQL